MSRSPIIPGLQAAFYWTIKTMAWPVTRLYVRLRVQGLRNVPGSGACIVVANHVSYVDPVVLGSAFPRRITFMITEPIYRLLRLRWFYFMMGAVPVAYRAPDPGALRAALRTLENGGVVGLFPEGQRRSDGTLGEGKSGAALLAARSGAPVVPAALIGAHRVMPVGVLIPRPLPITVVFGKPRRFSPGPGRRPTRAQVDEFAENLMQAIANLLGDGMEAPNGRGDAARRGTA